MARVQYPGCVPNAYGYVLFYARYDTSNIIEKHLSAWYLGVRCRSDKKSENRVKMLIERSWHELGKISQEEILVMVCERAFFFVKCSSKPAESQHYFHISCCALVLSETWFHEWLD